MQLTFYCKWLVILLFSLSILRLVLSQLQAVYVSQTGNLFLAFIPGQANNMFVSYPWHGKKGKEKWAALLVSCFLAWILFFPIHITY